MKSNKSKWTISFPNLPTLLFNLIIFFISIFMVAYAIATQNLTVGILAIVISKTEFKFEKK